MTEIDEPPTAAQLRAARSILDWTPPQLAKIAGVSTTTIWRIERGMTGVRHARLAIIEALRNAGVEFLQDDGVRLRPR